MIDSVNCWVLPVKTGLRADFIGALNCRSYIFPPSYTNSPCESYMSALRRSAVCMTCHCTHVLNAHMAADHSLFSDVQCRRPTPFSASIVCTGSGWVGVHPPSFMDIVLLVVSTLKLELGGCLTQHNIIMVKSHVRNTTTAFAPFKRSSTK